MVTPEILAYITAQLADGKSREEIRQYLRSSGWSEEDSIEALNSVSGEQTRHISLLSGHDLFQKVFHLYAHCWRQVTIVFLVSIIAELIVQVINLTPRQNGALGVVITLGTLVAGIASFLIGQLCFVALIVILLEPEKYHDWNEIWHRAVRTFFPYVWTTFLYMVIVGVGSISLFVLVVVWGVQYNFASLIAVREGRGGFYALLKSKEYVRTYWRSVTWRLIQFLLFLMGVTFMVTALKVAILFIAQPDVITMPHKQMIALADDIPVISSLISQIVSIIIMPLAILYWSLLFKELLRLKGNIAFEPTRREKIWVILPIIAGLLLLILLFFQKLMPFIFGY